MSAKQDVQVSLDSAKGLSATGYAYPAAVRWVATALVLGTLVTAIRAWDVASGELLHQVKWVHWLLAAAILGLLGWYYACLMRSRTTIANGELRQTWMWDKHTAIDDILKARFIGVPYAPWLMVTRLAVRTRDGKWIVFYSGSREVSAAFAHIDVAINQDLRRQMGL